MECSCSCLLAEMSGEKQVETKMSTAVQGDRRTNQDEVGRPGPSQNNTAGGSKMDVSWIKQEPSWGDPAAAVKQKVLPSTSSHVFKSKDLTSRVKQEASSFSGQGCVKDDVCIQSDLNDHKRTHSDEKPDVCDVSNEAFSPINSMNQRKRTFSGVKQHGGKKPFLCDVCKKAFTTSRGLQDHKQNVHMPNPHVCKMCFKRLRHLKRRTPSRKKPHVCDVCNKGFTEAHDLFNHMQALCGVMKGGMCGVCSKAFIESSRLIEKKHACSPEKPHICDVCNKAFSLASSLDMHKLYHVARPLICDVCKKSFDYAKKLHSHKLDKHVFTKDRMYLCKLCSEDITQSDDLNEHKPLQSGEKRYVCRVCLTAFAEGRSMQKHRSRHFRVTKKKLQPRHLCNLCMEDFSEVNDLIIHKQNAHKAQVCEKCYTSFFIQV